MSEIIDSEILPYSLEHGFWSWSAQESVSPIPVKRAKGVYFWDINDKRYLDFNSMLMCVNIGHGNERVINAIIDQARELPYAAPSMTTKPRALLGKILAEITPGDLNRFFFTLGGADANENAIKMARAYTGRHKILSRYRSYHGATSGAMSLTGDPRRVVWEPNLMSGVVHFLDPYRYRSTFHRTNRDIPEMEFCQDYLNHLEELINYEGPQTIAAIFLETVTGTNGIIIPPEGYLQGVRELCDKYNLLLICDEVMSGFGRTGKWFAVDNWDIVPDIMNMAKGLTSAYVPLGAVAMKDEIAEFFNQRVFYGGLTYNAHPISTAAAIATINVMKEEHIVENAQKMGTVLMRQLNYLGEKHPSVGEVRSIGLFSAIEVVRNHDTREPMALFNSTSPEMEAVKRFLLENGVYTFIHWNVIMVNPPLIINEQQLSEGIAVLDEALKITDQSVI